MTFPNKWEMWFAWHPVYTPTHWVWLEKVYRKLEGEDMDGVWYEYELVNQDG